MRILEWLVKYKLAKSNSDARRLIKAKAVRFCKSLSDIGIPILDPNFDMKDWKAEKI